MSQPVYPFQPLDKVLKYEKIARKTNVSEVARSRTGFTTEYKRVGGDESYLSSEWINQRQGFIARHLPQYNENPTPRRWLALMMWAYMPDKSPFDIKSKN